MGSTDEVEQLAVDLEQGDMRTRIAALARAGQMLASSRCGTECRERIMALLRTAAESDPSYTVKDQARALLADVPALRVQTLLPQREEMKTFHCAKCGLETHYAVKDLCSGEIPFVRESVRDGDETYDVVAVPCRNQQCPNSQRPENYLRDKVDCGRYREPGSRGSR